MIRNNKTIFESKESKQNESEKIDKKAKMLIKIYQSLLKEYDYQGWWPLTNLITSKNNGYHPKDYSYPKNIQQQYEICLGCILTQNTTWKNVEKAIIRLSKQTNFIPEKLLSLEENKLKEIIKPAGYYNQKSERIILFTKWFIEYINNKNKNQNIDLRKELISLKGIGNETCDSMLLYSFKQPTFIVDSYTKRIFANHGIIDYNQKYEQLRDFVINSISKTKYHKFQFYQEFHALLVEHAKRYYSKIKETKKSVIRDPIIKPS